MKRIWPFLIIGLAVGLVYLPSLPGDFHFDDYLLLLDNPDVNSERFRYASFLDHYGGRPLTLLSFHWNYHLAGRSPASYVAVNIVLHLLVSMLLFGWLRDLTKHLPAALGAALLFGIHPLQTQAVNYIWSRSMLLMAGCALAALWSAQRKHHGWSLLFFQLAIWGRTEAMAIAPFLLLLGRQGQEEGRGTEVVPPDRPSKWKTDSIGLAGSSGWFRSRGVLLLVGLNAAVFLVGLIRHAPAETAWAHSDILGYWLAQPAAILKYLSLMIWPFGLSIDHDFRPSGLSTFMALFLLVGLGYALIRTWRRQPLVSLAGVWTLLLLAPAALIPNQDLFNESRSYLALAGFAFAAAFVLLENQWLPSGWLRKGMLAAVLAVFAILSVPRNAFWNNNLGLWSEAAERYPNKLRIQYNLGHAQILEGQMSRAEASFHRALNLNPSDDLSYAALGYCAEIRGDWVTARAHYERAVELNEDNGYAVAGLERAERELAVYHSQSNFGERP